MRVSVGGLALAGCLAAGGNDVDPADAFHTEHFDIGGGVVVADDTPAIPGDVAVVLRQVDLSSGSFVVGDRFASARAGTLGTGGAFAFHLPHEADPADLYAFDPLAPESEIASYLLGAFIDDDASGTRDETEPLVAGGPQTLVYAVAPLSADLVDAGAEAGWNLYTPGGEGLGATATPLVDGSSDLELPANLLVTDRATLDLTVLPPLGEAVAVDLFSVRFFAPDGPHPEVPTLASTVVDATAAKGTGTLDLVTPPADHYDPDDGSGLRAATYFAIAYADQDGSGTWDPYAEPLRASTERAVPATLPTWFEPTGFDSGRALDDLGARPGWNLVRPGPPGEPPLIAPWGLGVELLP